MDISYEFKQKVWFVASVAVAFFAIGAVFVNAATYVLMIFAGSFFAVVISAFIDWMAGKGHMPRMLAFALVWGMIALLITMFMWFLFPALQNQFGQVQGSISSLRSVPWLGWLVEQAQNANLQQLFQDQVFMGRVGGAVLTVTTAVVNVFIVLFIAIYGSLHPGVYKRALVSLFPQRRQPDVREHMEAVSYTLSWWMIGRLSSMFVVSILTYIGLLVLGVDLALLLAITAGLFSFVPNIGPVLSMVPAALVALTQSPILALYVIGLYVFVQSLESYFITPFIQRWAISVPPAALLGVQVVFGILFGIIGIVLAAPLTAIAMVLFKRMKEGKEVV